MDFHTIVKFIFEVTLAGTFILSLGYFVVTACALALSRFRDKPEIIADESAAAPDEDLAQQWFEEQLESVMPALNERSRHRTPDCAWADHDDVPHCPP